MWQFDESIVHQGLYRKSVLKNSFFDFTEWESLPESNLSPLLFIQEKKESS